MNSTNDQTIQTYDNHVQAYIAGSPQVVDGELKRWIDGCFEGIATTAQILEIGSGTGKDADYLESKGYRVERTDASQGFVDYLQQHGKKAHLLNILTDTVEGPYDMIFANAVFLHFTPDELESIFRKLHAALAPGGKLIFTLKEGEGEEITDRKMGSDRYFHYWQGAPLRELLEKMRFRDITVDHRDDYRKDRHSWLMVSAEKDRT